MEKSPSRQPLLELDPALARGLSPREKGRAQRALRVDVVSAPPGPWHARAHSGGETDIGLLLVDGRVIRRLFIDGGASVELLGPGDLLRPWQEDTSSFAEATWYALTSARFAILDAEFARSATEFPAISAALAARTMDRSRSLAMEAAISNQVGVSKRVLLLLWHLAEKWGHLNEQRRPVVRTQLTHELIGEMVGARRPSVTKAFSELVAAGEIERAGSGEWLLKGSPPELSAN